MTYFDSQSLNSFPMYEDIAHLMHLVGKQYLSSVTKGERTQYSALLALKTWAVTSSWLSSCSIWKVESGSNVIKKQGREDSLLVLTLVRAPVYSFLGGICNATSQTAATAYGQNVSKLFFTLPIKVWPTDVLSIGSGQKLFLLLAVKILTVIHD